MTPAKRSYRLRRYIVAGLLVWLPILVTVWVGSFIVDLLDWLLLWLPDRFHPEALIGYRLPGIGGFIFAFLVLFVTGLLVTNFIGRRLVTYWEELMKRIPLVRSIYGGVRGFTESVFSQSSSFRKVVMVEYPRIGSWSIAFVTADDVEEVSARAGGRHVCVYVPTTPNPTSGFIIFVPHDQVVELEMSVDAAMKMIITCGVVVPPPQAPRLRQQKTLP